MTNVNKLPSMQELLEAGVHFGHKTSRANPKMSDFIFESRDGISIIDLAKTEENLKNAAEFATKLGSEGKVMLVVGTKKQARSIVEEIAKQTETPYITTHWVGGLLTNFDEIKRNIKKLSELKSEQVAGTLSRYTKKEQLLIARKLEKFDINLGGVADLQKAPDALFILDIVTDQTAFKEAFRIEIPVIGICDTNSNPQDIDYPIPANDDGIKSIKIIAEAIINAYSIGKKTAAKNAADEAEQTKKEQTESAELPADLSEQVAAVEEEIEKAIVEENSVKE